jgi:two-component system, chemotaxis family, chemotaxis protein CheY
MTMEMFDVLDPRFPLDAGMFKQCPEQAVSRDGDLRGRREPSQPSRLRGSTPRPMRGVIEATPRTQGRGLMARILVVDDAAFMRTVIAGVLTGNGHDVVGEAGNGAEAVERYHELRPELTTLDITMPKRDGLEALAEIISSDPRARVIMCSALGQQSKVLEALRLGARDFVVKPVVAGRLLEAVDKALG